MHIGTSAHVCMMPRDELLRIPVRRARSYRRPEPRIPHHVDAVDTITHHNELLALRRCGRCAEKVSPVEILRGEPCPHCGSKLVRKSGDVLKDLASRRLRWRIVGYGLVALASFLAGTIPLLQIAVQLVALFILHIIVLRGGLDWLSTKRRIAARVTIRLFGAAVAVFALLLNVAVAPLVGVSAVVLGASGPLLTALYIEGSLFILRRRLRWEADDEPLKVLEWLLPLAIALVVVGAAVATAGLVAGLLHFLASIEIPQVSELAQTLLEVV